MIFSQQVICKKCERYISTYWLVSTNTGGNQHTDLYQENIGTQAIHYMLTVCPSCQFVDYSDEFEVFKKYLFFMGGDNETTEEINSLMNKYPPTRRYIMLAERLEKENAPKINIADCYLKASWSERMAKTGFWFFKTRKKESRELEKSCQEKTVKYFSQALMDQEVEETADVFYLIGELYRRIGDFRSAIEYFEKAKKTLLAEGHFNQGLSDAGPQWSDIVKEIKKQLSISKQKAKIVITRGAKIRISGVEDLIPKNEDFLVLIEHMNLFALKKDSSHKVIEKL